jgi:hypothetical protein
MLIGKRQYTKLMGKEEELGILKLAILQASCVVVVALQSVVVLLLREYL